MRARRGHGNGGIPLDLIGQLIGSSLIRPRGEIEADRHRCNLCGKCQMICRKHAIFIDRKRRIWMCWSVSVPATSTVSSALFVNGWKANEQSAEIYCRRFLVPRHAHLPCVGFDQCKAAAGAAGLYADCRRERQSAGQAFPRG